MLSVSRRGGSIHDPHVPRGPQDDALQKMWAARLMVMHGTTSFKSITTKQKEEEKAKRTMLRISNLLPKKLPVGPNKR